MNPQTQHIEDIYAKLVQLQIKPLISLNKSLSVIDYNHILNNSTVEEDKFHLISLSMLRIVCEDPLRIKYKAELKPRCFKTQTKKHQREGCEIKKLHFLGQSQATGTNSTSSTKLFQSKTKQHNSKFCRKENEKHFQKSGSSMTEQSFYFQKQRTQKVFRTKFSKILEALNKQKKDSFKSNQ
ncbi:CLUMA_CG016643, isoform A [Clunio marinus]|uniref:CLUMA_CG016643, isoform A n=1 Tax=Clunio marinus TaxID=568069 RepID=A0A1J1ITH7_9DIPT|nr:CLUMA_CG016643, isoform A [Clunio marinus]